MPELPEVETVARDLRLLLVGRALLGVRHSRKALRQAWSKSWDAHLRDRRVEDIERRGKWLLVGLDRGSYLMVHLGMTGRFTVVSPGTPTDRHTHLIFPLDNADELRFRDARRFGSVTYFADRSECDRYLNSRLGPEPWEMTLNEFSHAIRKTRRPVKAALLDQTFIAGVGNIYADEACFDAGIDPRRPGNRLQQRRSGDLLLSVREVLTRAIESRGSSIRDYVGGSGARGGFQKEFMVYGRTGEPCIACGKPIRCVRIGGRSTHYCGKCQK
jgi:formamidopyrimidine-DNA glycosylase